MRNQTMNLKFLIYCLYLSLTYWISMHYPPLSMLFYPSLGSFAVILMNREKDWHILVVMTVGATTTSTLGSILYFLSPSIFTFFITSFVTLWIMHKLHWKAAPILAVALIPFFSHPHSVWVLPLSVVCSLVGISIPLWLTKKIDEKQWG